MTRLRTILVAALAAFTLAACDDPTGSDPVPTADVGVVLNSVDISLTIFELGDAASTRTVGLGPAGSPVSMAVRDSMAVVPLGLAPAAAVVNLASASLARTIGLPDGSGATGVAFAGDSIAVVANSNRNTVSPVNIYTGEVDAEIAVGAFPQAVLAVDGEIWVLNANLDQNFQPAGPGTISVLGGSPLQLQATIPLSGTNPGGGVVGPDGDVYVLNGGSFGQNNASLSVIDPGTRAETGHHTGFGDLPGSIDIDANGMLYVGSFGAGVLVWDAGTAAFVRGIDNPVAPNDVPSVSGLGVSPTNAFYTLEPACQDPGRAFRLDDAYSVQGEVSVGVCPVAIGFGEVAEGETS